MPVDPRKPSRPQEWVRTAGDVSIIPTMIGVGAGFGYAIGYWGFAPFFPAHRDAAIGAGVLLGLASAFRESYKILKRLAKERPARSSRAKERRPAVQPTDDAPSPGKPNDATPS